MDDCELKTDRDSLLIRLQGIEHLTVVKECTVEISINKTVREINVC